MHSIFSIPTFRSEKLGVDANKIVFNTFTIGLWTPEEIHWMFVMYNVHKYKTSKINACSNALTFANAEIFLIAHLFFSFFFIVMIFIALSRS